MASRQRPVGLPPMPQGGGDGGRWESHRPLLARAASYLAQMLLPLIDRVIISPIHSPGWDSRLLDRGEWVVEGRGGE